MSTAKSRERHYLPLIKQPETTQPDDGKKSDGQEALTAAWAWLLSEFKQLNMRRPEDAVSARFHAAAQIGNLAASLPKYHRTNPEPNKGGVIPHV